MRGGRAHQRVLAVFVVAEAPRDGIGSERTGTVHQLVPEPVGLGDRHPCKVEPRGVVHLRRAPGVEVAREAIRPAAVVEPREHEAVGGRERKAAGALDGGEAFGGGQLAGEDGLERQLVGADAGVDRALAAGSSGIRGIFRARRNAGRQHENQRASQTTEHEHEITFLTEEAGGAGGAEC